MNELNIISKAAAKVFGHLYIAVFSNGTVKAGMAKRNPQDRVTSHAHAGKAFGIGLETAFYASIYTDDTRARERLMHAEIGALAVLTAGREWFKFANVDAALNFASAYCCKAERMSFSERPSAHEIAEQAEARDRALQAKFPFSQIFSPQKFTLPNPATESELAELASVMSEYSLSVLASIASKIISLEEQAAECGYGEAFNTPILSDVINAHFCEHEKKFQCTGKLMSAEDEACLNEILKNGHPFSNEVCIKIIQAAAHYPQFFYEAMGFKVAA